MQHPRPIDLNDDQILALPIDRLGYRILQDFAQGTQLHIGNYLLGWRSAGVPPESDVMQAVAEACDWLTHSGLIGNQQLTNGFITRLGRQVIERGLPFLGAVDRIGRADLHPLIESVRTQFLLGEYELAAFAAMRAVEVRVRELGGYDDADIGKTLMRQAFDPEKGPLRDSNAEKGEREGLAHLFAGAIQVFKNPTSHRVVTFDDPSEAAEIVGLASLLLRILDHRNPANNTTIA